MLDAVILFNLIGDEWKKGGTMMIRKEMEKAHKRIRGFYRKKIKNFF
jgi:hypothetical protein